MTAQDLIDFESRIKDLWEAGELPCLLHLSGGNEGQLLYLWQDIKPTDWVFSTHRNHYHALMAGIPPDELEAKIKDGRSMFVYSKAHNFLCSAVLAGCCGIAAGVAWAIKNQTSENRSQISDPTSDRRPLTSASVYCFIGDGGEEEGHFYEAAMFVEANDLPCTFIIEDNDRSVDTPRGIRRGSAKGLEHLFKCVRRYEYSPTYPHAGSGCKFQIEFKPEAIERMKKR
jgi:TPP-dependent pyruvate/acetoin dehydrogenase alpha subunit